MSIGSKESDEVADEVGDGHNQLKELIEGQHLQTGKHKMLSKLATQSFNILRLIARNQNFLRP